MRDVQKTQVKKTVHHKKRRHRRYKASGRFYCILVLFFVAVAGIILSRTAFFNISKFSLEGNGQYSLEEMLASVNIKKGDNLFSMNFENAKQALSDRFPYIENVEMKRKLPDTLKITIEAAVPYMNIATENGTFYVVSSSGRILEKGITAPKDGVITIYGYEPEDAAVCTKLSGSDASKTELVDKIMKTLGKNEISAVSIDVTDKNIVYINYTKSLKIKLGEPTDIEYKLELAKAIIAQRGNPDENGIINVESTEYPSFMGNQ